MKFTRSAGVAAAVVMATGIALAPAASASASSGASFSWTVGPFGSQSTCDFNRYEYKQVYGVSPCWKGLNSTKWYFYAYITG
jgi:hypothetical protein